MAIEHPSRVRSLTSIMATTGDPTVGQPHPATMAALFGGPPARTREEIVAQAVRAYEIVGSPAFPVDPALVAETAVLAFDRDHDEAASARQAAAIPGAELLLVEGMGHDLPAEVWERVADAIAGVVRRGELRARGGG